MWCLFSWACELRQCATGSLSPHLQAARAVFEQFFSVEENLHQPLMWIHFQRLVMRINGVQEARRIFIRAKKHCSDPAIFLSCAQLEQFVNKDKEACRRIYELGLKTFPQDADFLLHYIDFLVGSDDAKNVRAQFETSLQRIPVEKSGELWNRYISFEVAQGSDIATIESLESRRLQAIPSTAFQTTGLRKVINRYRFENLWPASGDTLLISDLATMWSGLDTDTVVESGVLVPPQRFRTPAPMPDFSRMAAYSSGSSTEHFSSKDVWGKSKHVLPQDIAVLMRSLHAPSAYEGPPPDIPYLVDTLLKLKLPAIPIPENRSGMLHMTLPRTRKGASQRSGSGFSSRVMKRPAEQPLEDPSLEAKSGGASSAPARGSQQAASDLFTKRQQQRSRQRLGVEGDGGE